MAIQTGHSEAGLSRLAIVGEVELLRRKRCEEQSKTIQLHRSEQMFEQAVVVVDRDDLPTGHVAELRPVVTKVAPVIASERVRDRHILLWRLRLDSRQQREGLRARRPIVQRSGGENR